MYEFFKIVDELHDDPTLFPVLSAPHQPLPFELELTDGEHRHLSESKNISIAQRTAGGWSQLRTFRDLRFGVVVTQARLVVYCEKWTKGGGWRGFGLGGLAFAAAANAVSHARAAHRRKGKLLVAQVRYPWLSQAGVVCDKRGRPSALRLIVNAGSHGEQRLLAMDIPVGRDDPAALASGIVTMAARLRLSGGQPLPEQEAAALRQLAQDASPHGSNGVWSLPCAVPVGAAPSPPAQSEQPAAPADGMIPLADKAVPPVSTAAQPSPRGCSACGHVATVTAATCPRCGLAIAEPDGSPSSGSLIGATAPMRDPSR